MATIFLSAVGPIWAQPAVSPSPEPLQPLALPQAVDEPQDIGVLLRKVAKGFAPLEIHRAGVQTHVGLFSPVQQKLVIPGARSPVRFAAGQPVEFYLRIYLNDSDPRAAYFPVRDPNQFSLYRLQQEDEERELLLSESGMSYNKGEAGRPLLIRLFGQHSFQLVPPEPLTPGEYALKFLPAADQGYDVFCFGVDAPPER